MTGIWGGQPSPEHFRKPDGSGLTMVEAPLGMRANPGGEVKSFIDLMDSEIEAAAQIVERLNKRAEVSKKIRYEAFQQEIIEEFAENAKLVVDVKWYTLCDQHGVEIEGVLAPIIEIRDRLTPFDLDRQRHEVSHALLGIDQPGVIREDGTLRDPRRVFGHN